METGVLNPTKISRAALQHASSVIGLLGKGWWGQKNTAGSNGFSQG